MTLEEWEARQRAQAAGGAGPAASSGQQQQVGLGCRGERQGLHSGGMPGAGPAAPALLW